MARKHFLEKGVHELGPDGEIGGREGTKQKGRRTKKEGVCV